MSRMIWGTVGQRFYEAGADHGVLFVDGLGVPWNGLKTVTESPTGGDPRPFYLDGIKYLNIAQAEEFEATIEAFQAPKEFDPCDGEQSLYAGLSLTQQPRKTFSLSYRTLVGNDIEDLALGYKIHIVYNALAQPSQRSRTTLNNTIEPLGLSWAISTTPPPMTGFKPTAHLVIDSLTTSVVKMAKIEALLYGTDDTVSSLPSIADILTIFSSSDTGLIITDEGDGTFMAEGDGVIDEGDGTFTMTDDSITDHGDGTYST